VICPTCGAPSAPTKDPDDTPDWDAIVQLLNSREQLLAALKAITAAWDKREDDYVPGLQAALQLAEDAIEIAEGRAE